MRGLKLCPAGSQRLLPSPPANHTEPSAILPLIVGDEVKAVALAARLREQGIFIPAIRYPTVARGQARLRLTLTAAHSAADVEQLVAGLETLNLTP